MTMEHQHTAVATHLPRSRRMPPWVGAVMTPVLSGIGGILLWELVVQLRGIPPYLLPAPSLVFFEIVENWSRLMRQLGFTAFASLIGFVVALVLGIGLGALFTSSRIVERVVYPWLVIFHAIPKVVIAPLFLVWIGFGMKSETIFVVIFTIFPILVNTVTGLKAADPDLLQLARSMGATRAGALWKIRVPAALPTIMAGVKISATMAPVGAVIGEFVASNVGLGHLLIQAVGSLETPLAFAAVVVISVFGIAIWYLAELVERWLLPWHSSVRNTAGF
ncbi:NitT/TauT family transport system permease protein [Mesorhizobium sp. J18]|uniref:ABC transporter permease n=1 Tax=Mesorhizobium sp. J18 TaxID=935263 RepID=UPI001199C8E8|nr:ABC transporter permease [Mesorhizobium sp. J18]TWG97284.1 NitT/TauT family transport system permease protein [Mesorhizobium sp. J18]